MAATAAASPRTLPQSSTGRLEQSSIMSYCSDGVHGTRAYSKLNPTDIAAIQRAYGRRVSGQMVSVNGDCAAANPGGNGNPAFIWDCDEAAGQKWSSSLVQKSLAVASTYSCLDLPGAVQSNGTPLQIWSCLNNSNQSWVFENVAIVGWGGLCLDLQAGNQANGTAIQLWECAADGGNPNQRWSLAENGTIRFGSLASTKCLTASDHQRGQFYLWDCRGTGDQHLTFQSNGTLVSAWGQGFCADVAAQSDAEYLAGAGLPGNGLRLQSFGCNSSNNQKWNLSGPIKLAANHDKCVDLPGATNNNATRLQIWDCNGFPNQTWDYYR